MAPNETFSYFSACLLFQLSPGFFFTYLLIELVLKIFRIQSPHIRYYFRLLPYFKVCLDPFCYTWSSWALKHPIALENLPSNSRLLTVCVGSNIWSAFLKVKLHLQESILGFTPFDLVSQCLGNKVTLSVTIVLIALSLYRLSSFLLTLKSPIKSNGAVIHPKLPLFLQREIQAKSVQIVLSKHSRVSPYAEGIINKRIVLPSNIFKILKTQEVHAVLIHELAHLNIATQMLHFFTCAVNALFIFVPLKRIQLSLEQLCDSKILSTPLHPFSLATALGKVARSCRKAPVNKLALYSKFHLLTRIKALCLPPPKKMSHLLIFLWGLLALYFLLFLAMSQIGHF